VSAPSAFAEVEELIVEIGLDANAPHHDEFNRRSWRARARHAAREAYRAARSLLPRKPFGRACENRNVSFPYTGFSPKNSSDQQCDRRLLSFLEDDS
jgi:hypothetical protein